LLKRIASYLKGYERYVIGSPVLVIAETICQLIIPLLMARIINEGIEGNDMAVIWQSGGLMVLVPGAWSSYIWCILFGLIAGPAWPLTMSVAIDSFPENSGRIGTMLSMGGSTGGATVGVFMGMLADRFGLRACFLYPAAAGFLAMAAMLGVRALNRKKKKEQAA